MLSLDATRLVTRCSDRSQAAEWVATRNYRTSKWMANPGMPLLNAGWPLVSQYINDIVGTKADRRVLGFDIMNEPSRAGQAVKQCSPTPPTSHVLVARVHRLAPSGSAPPRTASVPPDPSKSHQIPPATSSLFSAPFAGGLVAFVEFAVNYTARYSEDAVTTVDAYSAVPPNLNLIEGALSYHSYYHYSHWHDCMANASDVRSMQGAAAAAQYVTAVQVSQRRERDLPVIVTEFGQSECYCPAAEAIQAAGVGWILWELLLSHDQFGKFQGLLYANGTARSEEEVACLRRLANVSSVSPS
jgi:hypothetical protein